MLGLLSHSMGVAVEPQLPKRRSPLPLSTGHKRGLRPVRQHARCGASDRQHRPGEYPSAQQQATRLHAASLQRGAWSRCSRTLHATMPAQVLAAVVCGALFVRGAASPFPCFAAMVSAHDTLAVLLCVNARPCCAWLFVRCVHCTLGTLQCLPAAPCHSLRTSAQSTQQAGQPRSSPDPSMHCTSA